MPIGAALAKRFQHGAKRLVVDDAAVDEKACCGIEVLACPLAAGNKQTVIQKTLFTRPAFTAVRQHPLNFTVMKWRKGTGIRRTPAGRPDQSGQIVIGKIIVF